MRIQIVNPTDEKIVIKELNVSTENIKIKEPQKYTNIELNPNEKIDLEIEFEDSKDIRIADLELLVVTSKGIYIVREKFDENRFGKREMIPLVDVYEEVNDLNIDRSFIDECKELIEKGEYKIIGDVVGTKEGIVFDEEIVKQCKKQNEIKELDEKISTSNYMKIVRNKNMATIFVEDGYFGFDLNTFIIKYKNLDFHLKDLSLVSWNKILTSLEVYDLL
jgi:hypothetical protein